jgi:hypothetical protein
MKLHTLSREHKEEYYFQSDYLFDASAIKLKNINSKNKVSSTFEIFDFIYATYLKNRKEKRYPTFQRGDVVKIKYTEEDLESVDLGISGIELSSPLSKLKTRLNETFVFIDTLRNDRETCVVFNKNNKSNYLLHISYLEKYI